MLRVQYSDEHNLKLPYIFLIDTTYSITISQIKYDNPAWDESKWYYDILVMKIVEDGDDVEVYHIGQGQGSDTDPDWDTVSKRSARYENTEPQCYPSVFLFATSNENPFTSTYGTVQNLKIQYGKFPNSQFMQFCFIRFSIHGTWKLP